MSIDAKKFLQWKTGIRNAKGTYKIEKESSFFSPGKTIIGDLAEIMEEYFKFRKSI